MQLQWRTQPSSTETEGRVRTLTTIRADVGTQPAASLLRRSATEIRTKETCRTSFATEMHMTRLRTGTKNKTVLNVNDVRKGTMITMALTRTSPTGNVLQPEDAMKWVH
jgi:hypothetical protein